MFHRKPLYVSFAQRKEERQAHLQMHYAQRLTAIPGFPSTAVFPGGYRPRFFPAGPNVIAPCPQSSLMYQPQLGVRPGWRGNGFVPVARPAFQAPRTPSVCSFHLHWIAFTLMPNDNFCCPFSYLDSVYVTIFADGL